MTEYCPNCGRQLNDGELRFGPGNMGCIYCTTICLRCGREVFEQDICHDENGQCCINCISNPVNSDTTTDSDFLGSLLSLLLSLGLIYLLIRGFLWLIRG